MAKRPKKPSKAYYASTDAAERRMQQALHDYDEAVTRMELKWGVDRLPWLAGQDLLLNEKSLEKYKVRGCAICQVCRLLAQSPWTVEN